MRKSIKIALKQMLFIYNLQKHKLIYQILFVYMVWNSDICNIFTYA